MQDRTKRIRLAKKRHRIYLGKKKRRRQQQIKARELRRRRELRDREGAVG